MKKWIALLLTTAMLLTLAACGEDSAAADPTAEAAQDAAVSGTEAPAEPSDGNITDPDMPQTVVYDDENCSFTVSLASENAHLGVTIDAQCVNKTDKDLMFTWNTVSICDYMFDPLWSQQVGPGESADSVIYIDTYQLEQYGIASVDKIEFTLYVFDRDDFMAAPFVNEVHTIYPTGLSAETLLLPERAAVDGEQVIADNDNVRFIIESFDDTSSAYTLRCYVQNRTSAALMYSWDNVTVNGCAIDPLWITDIAAGKQAYSEISFSRSDLEANGIETVEQIEFTLMVFNLDNWTTEPIFQETCTFLAENSAVG